MESLETRLNNLNKTIVQKKKSKHKDRDKQSISIRKKKSPEFKIDENEFPSISTTNKINSVIIDYRKIKDRNTESERDTDTEQDTDRVDISKLTIKPGWILLSHTKNSNTFTKDKSNTNTCAYTDANTDANTDPDQEVLSSSQILNLYERLSDRWNNFRDEQNDLYGQTSLYWNYREDLQNIIDEDNLFYNEIEDHIKYNKDQYHSEDEDITYADINEHI